MPDAPDWYTYRLESEKHVINDLAELAVRLESGVFYDRRGDVLWSDKMQEGSSAWFPFTIGSGAAITEQTTLSYWPGKALKLKGGSDSSGFAQITKYFAPLRLKSTGFEVSFAMITNYDRFVLTLLRNDGTNFYHSALRLHAGDNELQYIDSSGDWIKLDDLPTVIQTIGAYMNLKLVTDFENDKYVRVLFNQNVYDMAEIPIYQDTSSVGPYLRCVLEIFPRVGQNDYVYIGNVVFTVNEP